MMRLSRSAGRFTSLRHHLSAGYGLVRAVMQTLVISSVGLVFLFFNRGELCDAYLRECGTGGGLVRELTVLGVAVLLVLALVLGRRLLRPRWRAEINADGANWPQWLFAATAFGTLVAVFLVIVVRIMASAGVQAAGQATDPKMTVPFWVVGISLLAAAVPGTLWWTAAARANLLRVVLRQSPLTEGVRRFRARVLEATSSLPGVLTPVSGQPCAAWAIEAEETWSTSGTTTKFKRSTTTAPQGQASPSPQGKEGVTRSRSWTWLHGSAAPVAVQTTEGVVLLDLSQLVLKAAPAWEDAFATWHDHPLYDGMNDAVTSLGAERIRVTALPWGAEVEVTGRVELRADGAIWVTGLKMPRTPKRHPTRFVRRDGLRSLVQQPSPAQSRQRRGTSRARQR